MGLIDLNASSGLSVSELDFLVVMTGPERQPVLVVVVVVFWDELGWMDLDLDLLVV